MTDVTVNNELAEIALNDVKQFVAVLNDVLPKLHDSDEKSIKLYTTAVHGMKSAFDFIDETELSAEALKLERAGLNGDAAVLSASTPAFLEKIHTMIERVKFARDAGENIAESVRKNIFLVDDNRTNLTMGEDILSKHYTVFPMNSGVRLLKMLERHTPDLILLDVEMPELNGYDALALLKENENTKDIPVIFLTARSEEDDELKGLALGAVDYITKPFTPALLLKRIELHLLVESQKHELININKNLQQIVEARTKTVIELKNAVMDTFAELIECRDDNTGGHIGRTTDYLRIMIEAAGTHPLYGGEVAAWDTPLILQSAQLHDVGKIAIEDGILKKQGKLTDEEFASIKTHVTFGEEVIDKIMSKTSEQEFLRQAKILVSTHHEKWNGSGYPKGLKGEEIPLQGRMMAIADVYDALISDRPYKKAFTHNEAVRIITEGKGSHFDPGLVDIFLGINEKFDLISKRNRSNASV